MNKTLEDFARAQLTANLQHCTEDQCKRFKWMYARDNGKRSVVDAEGMPIESVVAEMPADRLDWAMQQVERTLKENAQETLTNNSFLPEESKNAKR